MMDFSVTTAELGELTPHPENYRDHPPDQIEHIISSIREHGLYRNIVVSNDNFILAGHGVVLALQQMGATEAPVVRVDCKHDSKQALKILVGDNEISHLVVVDDRSLTETLKSIGEEDLGDLIGTGFDHNMVSSLIYNTRGAGEVKTKEQASEWAGMPEFDDDDVVDKNEWKLVITFRSPELRDEFCEEKDVKVSLGGEGVLTWSTKWPYEPREKLSSVEWSSEDES